MTAPDRLADEQTDAAARARAESLAAIRADVRELTEPMMLSAGYWLDQPDGHSLKRTNVVALPDLLEQLVDAAEPVRAGGDDIPSSGSAPKSSPPIDLDPERVLRRITRQARGWIETTSRKRFVELDREAGLLRRQLDTAGRHLAAHERNLRIARTRLEASTVLLKRLPLDHPQLGEVTRRRGQLTTIVDEVTGYVDQWRTEITRLRNHITTAEGPRGAVLALNGLAGQLDDRLVHELAGVTRSWVTSARVTAHVDDRPVVLDDPCPMCHRRGALVATRGEFTTAKCTECRRRWNHDEVGLLTRMLDEQRNDAAAAEAEKATSDENVIAAIREGLRSAEISRSTFAEQLGLSKRHVVQVLASSATPGPGLLRRMAEAVVALPGEHAPQSLIDLTAPKETR